MVGNDEDSKRQSSHFSHKFFHRKPPKRIIQKPRKIKDSIPQRVLYKELSKRIPYPLKYNYPIRTWRWKVIIGRPNLKVWTIRYADVADTRQQIAFEYDGERFHKKKDKARDNELKRAGWHVIHFNKHNFQLILDFFDKTGKFINIYENTIS